MYKLTLLVLAFSGWAIGQKQANTWYFGNGAGLDFNDACGVKVLTDGAINGYEGCATISDATTGDLLFYTSSDSVWNSNHEVMPNGNLVPSGNTITQVLILQNPGSSTLYSIFTSEIQASYGPGIQWHQVDMSLNGGLGALTFKDSLIYASPMTEKLTAVRHANGVDYWVLAHAYNSSNFLAFFVSSAGVSLSPVISTVGKHHGEMTTFDAIGEMKASPDGTKLAVVTVRHPNIELFDFNAATGQVSNVITLPETGGYTEPGNSSGLYGLSFSSNSQMLYVTRLPSPSYGINGELMQFNIASNDSALINNSRVNVVSVDSKFMYSLKLGPDQKIYVGENVSDTLAVIENPNVPGMGCNYIDDAIFLEGKTSSWGLNNLPEYNVYCNDFSTIAEPEKVSSSITVYPNPASNSCTVTFDNTSGESYRCMIYNVQGKLMIQQDNVYSGEFNLDCSMLESGIYFLHLLDDQNNGSEVRLMVTN